MPLFLDRVGIASKPAVWSWRPRDCSLYALAVGAGFEDRAFVLDDEPDVEQRVYPTFPLTIISANSATLEDDYLGVGDFTGRAVVLGDQTLVLHAPVVPVGEAAIVVRVPAVYDKGSGALVVIEATGSTTSDGTPWFTATMGMFVVGEGGFGGDRGPSRRKTDWPARPPDHVASFPTTAVHSLWYRHAGNDTHGIHVDAAAARAVGFDAPILTGQNTLGVATRAIVHRFCDGDPTAVGTVSGRFASPGYNGDLLITEAWMTDATGCVFRVVNHQGDLLVDDGRVELTA
jgi:acyl dehydratase